MKRRPMSADELAAEIERSAAALVSDLQRLPTAAREAPEIQAAADDARRLLTTTSRRLYTSKQRVSNALDRWASEPIA